MIPNPWILLALVLAWGGSCALAYHKGGEHREHALIAERAAQQAEDADRLAKIAAIHARKRTEGRRINQALDDEVYRYVSSDPARADCFDADGLQLFNAIAGGTLPLPGGRARAGLPAPAAAGQERQPRRGAARDEAGR